MLIKHYNLHCGSFPSLQKLFLDMSCILTSDLTCWQVRAGNASRSGQVTCPAQGVQVQVMAGQVMSRLQVWLGSPRSRKVAKQSTFPFAQRSSSKA